MDFSLDFLIFSYFNFINTKLILFSVTVYNGTFQVTIKGNKEISIPIQLNVTSDGKLTGSIKIPYDHLSILLEVEGQIVLGEKVKSQ